MTAAVLKGKDFWTPFRRVMAGVARGRRPGRLPGGHIDDRVGLRQAIQLCRDCRPKFDAAKAGYVTKLNIPIVRGRCDGCQHYTERADFLVHSSLAGLR